MVTASTSITRGGKHGTDIPDVTPESPREWPVRWRQNRRSSSCATATLQPFQRFGSCSDGSTRRSADDHGVDQQGMHEFLRKSDGELISHPCNPARKSSNGVLSPRLFFETSPSAKASKG